jgi:pyrroline-5-carboxylate reductase
MPSFKEKRFAIIGAGNMGLALMRGLLDSGVAPDRIAVSNKRFARSKAIAEEYGVRPVEKNADAVKGADIVILAIKPQIISKILPEIRQEVGEALVISIAAGVTTERIERELEPGVRVIRAMPNTPATIKQAATALSPGAYANETDVELAVGIFQEIGRVAVLDEIHLDAITGLCGSGPAYVFLIVEAFADAGVKVGLSREIATELAVQTIQGSARLLQITKEHPGKLKDQVTSPGGTAIAGLHTLEEGGLRTTIMNAVEAATRRSRELGQE